MARQRRLKRGTAAPVQEPGEASRGPVRPLQVVVLGMHRSGTSALTGALHRMGLQVGTEDELTGASWENPDGFFERRDFRKICDALLQGSGADWWKVSTFDPEYVDHSLLAAQRVEMGKAVRSLNAMGGSWAVKEPRLCFLLPLFRAALRQPVVLFIYRHPLEVARSLRRRNGFPIRAGLALWEAYNSAALQHSRGLDRIRLSFDELTDRPADALARIEALVRAKTGEALDLSAATAGINPDLRRERAESSEGLGLLTEAQRRLWSLLQSPDEIVEVPELSGEARNELRQFEADQLDRQRLEARLSETKASLSSIKQELERRKERAAADAETIKALRAESAALLARAEAADAALRRAESQQGAADAELAALRSEIEARSVRLQALQDRLAEAEKRLAVQEAQLGGAGREADLQKAAMETLRGELARAAARVEDLEGQLGQLVHRRDALSDQLWAKNAELETARADLGAARAEADRLDDRVHALEQGLNQARSDREAARQELAKLAADLVQARQQAKAQAEAEGLAQAALARAAEAEADARRRAAELEAALREREDELAARAETERLAREAASARAAEAEADARRRAALLEAALRERGEELAARAVTETAARQELQAVGAELARIREEASVRAREAAEAREQARGVEARAASERQARLAAEAEARRTAQAYESRLAAARDEGERLRADLTAREESEAQLRQDLARLSAERAALEAEGARLAQARELLSRSRALRAARAVRRLGRSARARLAGVPGRRARLEASGLFDAGWYLSRHPDVGDSGLDPLDHYLLYGGREGRDPHPLFDHAWYVARAPRAEAGRLTALEHYLAAEPATSASPHPLFDADFYRQQAADLVKSGLTPLQHYLRHGGFQGLRPNPQFDSAWYLTTHADVAESGMNPLLHYVAAGSPEGRATAPASRPPPSAQTGAPRHMPAGRSVPCPFPSEHEIGLVSVIVPVHNALDDVRRCLTSIVENTFPAIELIVVNDGSDAETSLWLESFAAQHPHVELLRHETAQGYTKAVNAGAAAAQGSLLVTQNSDTLVPPFWLERLCAPLVLDEAIAAAGPTSNAASWQSVPRVKDRGGWSTNADLGDDVRAIDEIVLKAAEGLPFERVGLLNGFCYAVRTRVFRELGGLDGEAFPSGYGEETDLFMRMGKAGHGLVVVPNLFVHHAKSKSFGAERRARLSSRGNEILYERYGKPAIAAAAGTLERSRVLAELRARLDARIPARPVTCARPRLGISFLLPVRPGGGGVHSVVQEAQGLGELGHRCEVIVPAARLEDYRRFYPAQEAAGLFRTYGSTDELCAAARGADVVVATHFKSVRLLRDSGLAGGGKLIAYYVQDYEPWITEPGSDDYAEAYESYTALPGALLVAKTNWICRMVRERHGVGVHKIAPSIDRTIYNLEGRIPSNGRLRLAAMLRPRTPRRGAQATIDVLSDLAATRPDLQISVFGCTDGEMRALAIPDHLRLENLGVLVREQVAELLKRTDLFIDMSTYQAFGRTAIEAMACGAVAVVPDEGGGREYSMGGRAAVHVPTHDPAASAKAILQLLNSSDKVSALQSRGTGSAGQFCVQKSTLSLECVIRRALMDTE